MHRTTSIPSLSFQLVLDGIWTNPARYLENPDSLLKFYLFSAAPDWGDLGLQIEYDGIAWNHPELVESPLNLLTWFQGVQRLIAGETEVDIWAWEESNCKLRREGDAFFLSDLSPDQQACCPIVGFSSTAFTRELVREGYVAIEFLERMRARIEEICRESNSGILPPIVIDWIKGHEDETVAHISARRYRWQEIRDVFTKKWVIDDLRTAVREIERA